MRYAAVFALTATLLAACGPMTTNTAPTVTLAPAAAQTVLKDAPATKLTATATDDGTIAKVEFLDGTAVVATDTTAPYEFTPPTATVGEKTYVAKAYDDKGLTGVSAGVKVTVNAPVPVGQAKLRAVHAASDVTGVDAFIGGTKVNTSPILFSNVFPATGYADVPEGALAVKVCLTGTTTCPAALDKTLNVVKDTKYTALVVGTVDAADDTGATPRPLEYLVATDAGTVDATKGQVRLIHAASVPAADKVDIYVTSPTTDITPVAVTTPLTSIAYKTVSAYIPVAPGDYRVRITAAGSKTVLIDSGTVAVAAGKLYTGIAINPAGGDPTKGVILLNDN